MVSPGVVHVYAKTATRGKLFKVHHGIHTVTFADGEFVLRTVSDYGTPTSDHYNRSSFYLKIKGVELH